ncbi:MAG: serine/threonine-protein kinase [Phycisphaeraceae bacterium]|nr:serine/threonine-protein kinase [Phycisphaeraceae bacterium]
MSLSRGTRLGQFEIAELVGVGGVGEVYRATDTKLGRDVAIKVLSGAFTLDGKRLARFNREARLLASLDHPNICVVHDLQESEGIHFMVMPLIEGDTLAGRIARGAMSVEQALPIFAQIAEALEAAHEQGIIHRDLKPGNIKVSEDGKVKVLDFGLGKAIEYDTGPVSSDASTCTRTPDSTRLSQEGIVLGTPVYMSPEQARGKPVDKRTDIWAFGCCLYEALTGEIPFEGDTISDTLAKVLERNPDWDLLPEDTPWRVRDLLESCLEKDVRYRVRDIGDAWAALQRLITESGQVKAQVGELATPRRSYVVAVSVVSAALIISAFIIFAMRGDLWPAEMEPKLVRRLSINLPATHPVSPDDPSRTGFVPLALSPDGTVLVYVADVGGSTQLVKRPMNQLEGQPMPGTEGAGNPFFAPDGQWIGFFADNELKKVSVRGGVAITLCDAPSPPLGASWGDDGFIVFSSDPISPSVLHRVSAAGGTVEDITSADTDRGDVAHITPTVLPRGKGVLFTAASGTTADTMQAMVLPPGGGAPKCLVKEALAGPYLPTGHLLYATASGLMLVPFDIETLEIGGMAFPAPLADVSAVALSQQGTVAYLRIPEPTVWLGERRLIWVDRKGKEEVLAAPPRPYKFPRISPDGERIALTLGEPSEDIWLYDLARGILSRFTLNPGYDAFPAWTPDGRRIVFSSTREDSVEDLFWQEVDGVGVAECLLKSPGEQPPFSLSRDGKAILFYDSPRQGMGVLFLEGEPAARTLLEGPFNPSDGDISPDGRWLAYNSRESGEYEIFVQAFPELGKKMQISTDGGRWPLWAPDGTQLYYRNSGKMMAVSVETRPSFKPGTPEVLFEGSYFEPQNKGRNYDISPDGERFLMIEGRAVKDDEQVSEMSPRRELIIVENWLEEIKRLAPHMEK